MNITNSEIISLALIGATSQAAQLRSMKTQPETLAKLEQEIIPHLALLSQIESQESSQKKPKKKKK